MKNIIAIETKNTHYVLGVDKSGVLHCVHWGKKANFADYGVVEKREINSNHSVLDCTQTEYTVFGGTMYRGCAFKCTYGDGCRDSVFKYKSHIQRDGSLDVTLVDPAYNVEIVLSYKYSRDSDVITKYITVINNSGADIKIERIMSGELCLPGCEPYDVTNTNGSWGGEFQLETAPLKAGTAVFESRKGTAGHTNSPFVVLSQNATEDCGRVYFAALGYGGNFKIEASRDFIGKTRVIAGISDFDFSYTLKNGDSFTTPKLYFGMSDGFADMSNMMNKFAVDNILPKSFAKSPLPVLYNSWEATGFDVDCENQLQIAEIAKKIGCELFVVDDGWFGARNNDCQGLGDWYVNNEKFPDGIDRLISGVNALGMDFGLWFEPEMVQEKSNLYKAHPDWTYHYDTRTPSELRHQRVLNLTKPEVKQFVFECMDKMLAIHNIRYIKWDMNRLFSEIGASNLENPQELWYRHTAAVYDIADRLKAKYPYLQLEACSSGGGRAELGALEHFDMAWTSDNTDPVDRLDIQRGYSMLYPIKCMRAWVTDWNNTERSVSLDYRFNSSMQGSLSIGANLLNYSAADLEKCKHYISLYKKIRATVQFGDFFRLKNFDNAAFYATQYVSADKSQSVLFICDDANSFFNKRFVSLSLKGLDENAVYDFEFRGKKYSKYGSYLMNVSHEFELKGALQSDIVVFEKRTD